MSTFILPKNLSRRGRLLLFAAFTVLDDSGDVVPEGEPPSALTTLQRLCDCTQPAIHGALTELCGQGLAARRREAGTLRVRIALDKLRPRDGCEVCGSLSRGTGRWCARCKQVLGRDDRAWQIRAIELHGSGYSPPRIAAVLGRPLFTASAEDGRDPNGGAVVPLLLGKSLLGGEWARRLREAQSGPVDDV